MVFKLLSRFIKYLFSSLKKDAALQHREERTVAKERKSSLNEIIRRKKASKETKKIGHEGLQVLALNKEVIPFLESFIGIVEAYLNSKDARFISNAQEKFKYVSEKFSEIVKHWKEILSKLEESVKNSEKMLNKDESDLRKDLGKENRILKKEYGNLTRSEKEEDLDQVPKEAIIKKKMNLLRNHLALLNQNKDHLQNVSNFNKNNHEKVKSLIEESNRLKIY